MINEPSLYEQDFYTWTKEQVQAWEHPTFDEIAKWEALHRPVGENSQIIGLLRYSPIHHWLDRLQAFRFTLSLFSRKWDAPAQRRVELLDWEHLAQELAFMGISEKVELSGC